MANKSHIFEDLKIDSTTDLSRIRKICKSYSDITFSYCSFDNVDFSQLCEGNKNLISDIKFIECSFSGDCKFTEMYKNCTNIKSIKYLRDMFVNHHDTSTIAIRPAGITNIVVSKVGKNADVYLIKFYEAGECEPFYRLEINLVKYQLRFEKIIVKDDIKTKNKIFNFSIRKKDNKIILEDDYYFNESELELDTGYSISFADQYRISGTKYNTTLTSIVLDNMFVGCSNITEAIDLSYMFANCSALKSASLRYMFSSIVKISESKLIEDYIGVNRFYILNCSHMFANCYNLVSAAFDGMLKNCEEIRSTHRRESKEKEDIVRSYMLDFDYCFLNCEKLNTATFDEMLSVLNNVVVSTNSKRLLNCEFMFAKCLNLNTVSFYKLFDHLVNLDINRFEMYLFCAFVATVNRKKKLNITYSGKFLENLFAKFNEKKYPIFYSEVDKLLEYPNNKDKILIAIYYSENEIKIETDN